MILSAQSIRKREFMITPFCERSKAFGMSYGLSSCGYDVRIAEQIRLTSNGFSIASTIEKFNIPSGIVCLVKDKSTWARQGLSVFNTVIEPGWRGYLTLELANHGSHTLNIEAGSPIAQILFWVLDQPTEMPYSGKYQEQEPGAQPALFE